MTSSLSSEFICKKNEKKNSSENGERVCYGKGIQRAEKEVRHSGKKATPYVNALGRELPQRL